MSAKIPVNKQKVADFCRRYCVRTLALFGSVLREDFRPESDVDVLVEFEPGQTPGFIRLFDMEEELATLLGGHKPDVVTEKFLNRRIRNKVLSEAQVQYVRT